MTVYGGVKPQRKPALGLMPEEIYENRRITDILDAMERYSENEQVIPIAWIQELRRRITTERR